MKNNYSIKLLIFAIFFISLGGWLLHIRVHPIIGVTTKLIPFIFGIISVFFIPILMFNKKTVILGYIINGFSVIIGTITMLSFSLIDPKFSLSFVGIILHTTLADIFVLFSKLFIAHLILIQYYPQGLGRLFTLRWWIAHFTGPAFVFAAGYFLWR